MFKDSAGGVCMRDAKCGEEEESRGIRNRVIDAAVIEHKRRSGDALLHFCLGAA